MHVASAVNRLNGDRKGTGRYVVKLEAIGAADANLAGGKGANLGELSRIDGIAVPAGFCITAAAFRHVVDESRAIDALLDQLSRLQHDDGDAIRMLAAEIRRAIEDIAIPEELASEIASALANLDEEGSYAVRSSATAEDSTAASFAGQHDTYLDVCGPGAILQHVGRCWASLFTERAVAYRLHNAMEHRSVQMAAIVQRMVPARASGVLFTADPMSGNRKVISIEAAPGLGEALVCGLVNPDVYIVRDDVIAARTLATKPILTNGQVARLATLGRRIEAHFGCPQDIEWCLADGDFQIVQSRPITTLYPLPATSDAENRVYVSVGHQQMMTDAMKPLGISMWQLTAAVPMHEAGARLFVDVSRALSSAAGRAGNLALLSQSDPLTGDALRTIIDRDFIPLAPEADAAEGPATPAPAPLETDPAIVEALIARMASSNAALKREIATKSGDALFDFVLADVQDLKRRLFDPRSLQAIMAGIDATRWLNERILAWLGERNAADALAQSVSNNVTSEMGLALLQVADAIRPHPAVVAFLQRVDDDGFLDELPSIEGGQVAKDAIDAWLDRHGMRGVGEIDITRPRWRERPTLLVPLILANVRNFETGAGELRFAQGLRNARDKQAALLDRLRALPDGERKARETKAMIDRLRTFVGYRECPKYYMIDRHFAYKTALIREAERLVRSDVLRDRDDAFFLTFHELRDAARTNMVDRELIDARKEAFRAHQRLAPPRVLTSDGEMLNGAWCRDDAPAGALAGLAVSAGTVEGRARIVFDLAKADIEPGDILVTPFTDPSWTPLFVAVSGLVTEVGGLMTHGSVVAREYGLPAVVGVTDATRLIRDGQRIRVHGTAGYVELLS